MRTIEINGHEYEIRPLKRKEVKQLRKNGYILTALNPQTAEDAMDQVFKLVFTSEQLTQIDERPRPGKRYVYQYEVFVPPLKVKPLKSSLIVPVFT